MSRLGYIQNSYGSQFNIGIANTYSNNILTGSNLPANSIIVSSNIDDEGNDTGTYSLLATDYQGNAVRLTYTIQEGNGLYYDEKNDSLSLHIDNTTILNNNGVLSATLSNSINNIVLKSNDNKIYVDTQNLPLASSDNYGVGNIDGSTIKSDEGTIYVDTHNLQYSNTDSNIYGVGIGDGKTITINNGKMNINEEGFNHADGVNPGVVKPDNITVNVNNDGILSVNTQNLRKASVNDYGVIEVDGKSVLSDNGEIYINTEIISLAQPLSYGVSKVNTKTLNLKDGIISFKDYYTIKNKIDEYQNINIEYNKKISEFNQELSQGNYFYKEDDIIIFNVNETSVTTLEKPKYLEEVIKMLDQYVNIDFNIVTTCDFNVSVIFDRNTNEFPSVTLLKVNYNDEFEYDGEQGILQDTIYPSTNGELKKLTLKFWAKNFNNSVVGESLVTSLKVTVSNIKDINKQKTEKYSIIRYNSLYEKHEEEKAELEDDTFVIIQNSIKWRDSQYREHGYDDSFKSMDSLVNWKVSLVDLIYKVENVKTNEIFTKEKDGVDVFTFMDKSTDTTKMISNTNTKYHLGYEYDEEEWPSLDDTLYDRSTGIPNFYNNLVVPVYDSINGIGYSKKILLKSEPFPGAKIIDETDGAGNDRIITLHTLAGEKLENINYIYNGSNVNMHDFYGRKIEQTSSGIQQAEPESKEETAFYLFVANSHGDIIGDDIDLAKEYFFYEEINNDPENFEESIVDNDYVILRKSNINYENTKNRLTLYSNYASDGSIYRLYIVPQGDILESMDQESILSKLSIIKRVKLNKEALIYNLYPSSYDFIFGNNVKTVKLENLNKYIVENNTSEDKDYYYTDWKEGAINQSVYRQLWNGEPAEAKIESISYETFTEPIKSGYFVTKNDNEYYFGDNNTYVDYNFVQDFSINTENRKWSVDLKTKIWIEDYENIPNFNKYFHLFYNEKLIQNSVGENEEIISGTVMPSNDNLLEYSRLTCNIFSNPKFTVDYTDNETENFSFVTVSRNSEVAWNNFNMLYNDVDIYGNDPDKVYLNTYMAYDKDDNELTAKNYIIEYSYIVNHIDVNGDKGVKPTIYIERDTDDLSTMSWKCTLNFPTINPGEHNTLVICYSTNIETANSASNIVWKKYTGQFNVSNGTLIASYSAIISETEEYLKISNYDYTYAFEEIPGDISDASTFVCLYQDYGDNTYNQLYIRKEIPSYITTSLQNINNDYEIRYHSNKNLSSNYILTDYNNLTQNNYILKEFSQNTFNEQFLAHLIGLSNLTLGNFVSFSTGNISTQYIYLQNFTINNFDTNFNILSTIGANCNTLSNTNQINLNDGDNDGFINNVKIIQIVKNNSTNTFSVNCAVPLDILYDNYYHQSPSGDQTYQNQKSSLYTLIADYVLNLFNGNNPFKLYEYSQETVGDITTGYLNIIKSFNSLNCNVLNTDINDPDSINILIKRANTLNLLTFRRNNQQRTKLNLYDIYDQTSGLRIKYNINKDNINKKESDELYCGVIHYNVGGSGIKIYVNLYLNNTYLKQIGVFNIFNTIDLKNNIELKEIFDQTQFFYNNPTYELKFIQAGNSANNILMFDFSSNSGENNQDTGIEIQAEQIIENKQKIHSANVLQKHEYRNIALDSNMSGNNIIENESIAIDGQSKVLYISTIREDLTFYNKGTEYYADYLPVHTNSGIFPIGNNAHKYYIIEKYPDNESPFNIYFTLADKELTRDNYDDIYTYHYPLMKSNYTGNSKAEITFTLARGKFDKGIDEENDNAKTFFYVVNENQTNLFKPTLTDKYEFNEPLAIPFTNRNPYIPEDTYKQYYDLSKEYPEDDENNG